MKSARLAIGLMLLFSLGGCLRPPLHQGNVLDEKLVQSIQVGDTRLEVESRLGEPILQDALHPRRALYVEDFEDKEHGRRIRRGIVIEYDSAFRVQKIRRFGFD